LLRYQPPKDVFHESLSKDLRQLDKPQSFGHGFRGVKVKEISGPRPLGLTDFATGDPKKGPHLTIRVTALSRGSE